MQPMRQLRVLRAAIFHTFQSRQKPPSRAAGAARGAALKDGELGRQHGEAAVSEPWSGMVQTPFVFGSSSKALLVLVSFITKADGRDGEILQCRSATGPPERGTDTLSAWAIDNRWIGGFKKRCDAAPRLELGYSLVLVSCVFSLPRPSSPSMKTMQITEGGENMKKILIPLFGVALVTAAALIAAPQKQKPESCEPCNPADCCPEQGQSCCPSN